MADRQKRYEELVSLRKQCNLCRPDLVNPQLVNKEYDCDEIGAWSQWYGSLDAKIMLIGQDWGTIQYYNAFLGKDDPDNDTMKKLIALFGSIDIPIKKPYREKNELLFFTNTVLCLKDDGQMSKSVKEKHCLLCATRFLKPLIEMIQPKILIALGRPAFRAVCHLYNLHSFSARSSRELVEIPGGIRISDDLTVFPVVHCSGLGCRNRNFSLQLSDWKKIRQKIIDEKIV